MYKIVALLSTVRANRSAGSKNPSQSVLKPGDQLPPERELANYLA